MNKTKTNAPDEPKLPAFEAYRVREREGEKSVWTRLGAAWPHIDGRGFTIQLEANPTDGRIVLRVASEKKE